MFRKQLSLKVDYFYYRLNEKQVQSLSEFLKLQLNPFITHSVITNSFIKL